ncbi:hypothetical protein Taro_035107 [Colocasia esculenta]|uniref:TAF6 C-terminal HEAT repeat domain-containing protein n=1 Tax=Colocasia esculenta TaxID=4460 RepID=A0A843WHL0_COLES|nr:hypothetical protein [Colocasia esculenta]
MSLNCLRTAKSFPGKGESNASYLTFDCMTHWLAIEGVQPAIPENVPMEALTSPAEKKNFEHNKDDAIPVDIKLPVKHVLSRELQLYFDKITGLTLSGSDSAIFKEALVSLATDSGLHPLVPYFSYFIADEVTRSLNDLPLLIALMRVVRSLLCNPHIHIEPYLHQLMPSIITCLVAKRLGHRLADNHWELRDFSASLVASICRRFGHVYHNLQSRVTKTLLNAFLDPSKAMTQHYGAIQGLAALGPNVVRLLILPNLEPYLQLLEPEMLLEKQKNEAKRNEAWRVYGALISTCQTYDLRVHGRHRVLATVTRRPATVRSWLHGIRRLYGHRYKREDLVVGLGVQWRFNRHNAGNEPVATIQLCIGHRCLIFQVFRAPAIPRALSRFLADPSITCVSVGIAFDRRKLAKHCNLDVANGVELRQRAGMGRASLQEMAREFLGWELDDRELKPPAVGLSNWEDLLLNKIQGEAPVAIRHLNSEASHRTYLLQIFDSHVLATVTSSPAAARRWVHHVRYNHSRRVRSGRLVVGMAAQWRRAAAAAPAAVLQLCVGHRCLVFQLASCTDVPEALKNFLADARVSFAAVGAADSTRRLEGRGLQVPNVRELRRLAAFKYGVDWKDTSMEGLAHLVLAHRAVRESGGVDWSDWESPVLTTAQVMYACVDAYVAFRLGLELLLDD